MSPCAASGKRAQLEAGNLLVEDNVGRGRVRLRAFQQRLFEVKCWTRPAAAATSCTWPFGRLLDLEKAGHRLRRRAWIGTNLTPTVKPDQMLGLEINSYAVRTGPHGPVDWLPPVALFNNGFPYQQNPILTPAGHYPEDRRHTGPVGPGKPARNRSGRRRSSSSATRRFWAAYQCGDSWDTTTPKPSTVLYGGRIPNSSDLCCYWLEKARGQLESGKARRAGLLATQAIRFQNNRRVLARIKNSGNIFSAISDQNWVLEGANVHISIVCFDDGSDSTRTLDGEPVSNINTDLTAGANLTQAKQLAKNANISFAGDTKHGPFEIDDSTARKMLVEPNPHGKPNRDVVRPWSIGRDINQKSSSRWIIDFGVDMPLGTRRHSMRPHCA